MILVTAMSGRTDTTTTPQPTPPKQEQSDIVKTLEKRVSAYNRSKVEAYREILTTATIECSTGLSAKDVGEKWATAIVDTMKEESVLGDDTGGYEWMYEAYNSDIQKVCNGVSTIDEIMDEVL